MSLRRLTATLASFDYGVSRRAAALAVLTFAVMTFLAANAMAQPQELPAQDSPERQLFDLANQARSQAGVQPLVWDITLATAAHTHATRMAVEGELSHQYQGEPDLATRVATAGAHFSVVEENIAIGNDPMQIHSAWMQSAVHHANMISSQVDHVGLAVIQVHGQLYAVADFAQAVASLSEADVEARVGKLVTAHNVRLRTDPADARQYCAQNTSPDTTSDSQKPRFFMHWQTADLSVLPQQLEQLLDGGQVHEAEIGACAGDQQTEQSKFSQYRIAVLLY